MSVRRPDVYPRIHRVVVEILLILLILHGAFKFLKWLCLS